MTRIAFSTLGCKVNQFDTAALQSSIRDIEPYRIVPFDDEADIYVVNTCTVTGKGDAESRRLIRRALKQNNRAQIIVTGCYAQTNPEDIAKIDGVSLILGNEEKFAFRDHLEFIGNGPVDRKIFVDDISNVSTVQNSGLTSFPARTRAFLKVQDGCDFRCSYCIVPFARGNSRSLPPDDVVEQISGLSLKGYKEIVLCGIHLGGYGRDLSPRTSLSSLLVGRILTDTDIPRIRLSSIEPREITDDLIDLMASEDRICKHFHIPIQSGDDYILRQMNRNYDSTFYADLVLKIKGKTGDSGIGCDVMVGYPGEGEEHFDNTYRLIERLPLTYLHVFAYSPRPGTAAYAMRETVKGDVKQKRSDALREIGERKNLEFKRNYIGRIMDVLIEEERDEVTGLQKGYTGNYLKVVIPLFPLQASRQREPSPLEKGVKEDSILMNQIVKVKLSGIMNDSLSGELLTGTE